MPAPATARCAANSTASGGKGIPFCSTSTCWEGSTSNASSEFELTKAPEFDHVVVNDVLDTAVAEVERIVRDFLS